MKNLEHVIQTKFVARVRHLRHDLLCWSTPNGGLRKASVAAQLKAEGVLAGVPDIFIAKATKKYSGLFLEFKTPKGRVSPVQKAVIAKLRTEGYCVEIVRSVDAAWQILMEYLEEDLQ